MGKLVQEPRDFHTVIKSLEEKKVLELSIFIINSSVFLLLCLLIIIILPHL